MGSNARRKERMKTITVQYTFPENYEHEEVVATINGAITDMDSNLATELSYKLLGENNG